MLGSYCIVLVLHTSVFVITWCQPMSEANRLLQDKLGMYNKSLRPVNNVSDIVDVNMTTGILSVKGFDEVFEKVSITGYIMLEWTNVFMEWDPDHYGGVKYVTGNAGELWHPNIVNSNTADKIEPVRSDWFPLNVRHDGWTITFLTFDFAFQCRVNVYYYPFDQQTCILELNLWGYTEIEVFLQPIANVELSYYRKYGPWEIMESRYWREYYNFVYYEIKLKRQPEFLVLSIVAPTVLLALLNTLVFFIHPEHGDRASFSITLLLSIAVFMTLVGETLPKTSHALSLFGFYVFYTLVQSGAIIVAVVHNECLRNRPDTKSPPGCILTYVYKSLHRCKRENRSSKRKVDTGNLEKNGIPKTFMAPNNQIIRNGSIRGRRITVIPQSTLTDFANSNDKCLEIIQDGVQNTNSSQQYVKEQSNDYPYVRDENIYSKRSSDLMTDTSKDGNPLEHVIKWSDISQMLDTMYFILFLSIVVTVTITCIIIIGLQ